VVSKEEPKWDPHGSYGAENYTRSQN